MKESSIEKPDNLLKDHRWSSPLYLIMLLATAMVVPICFLGNASGHDFQPHLATWMEVANQWRDGIIYPHWAAGANYNFGDLRFIFYPPLSWLIGAALGSILPWKIVPGIYVWLCIVVAGIAMWRFAREYLSRSRAIAAALFFAANPYHVALIYYRSAYAELLASAIFPLVIAGALGTSRRMRPRIPLLAASFAAIWLSNAPAAVITTYSLALLLVVACFNARSIRPFLMGSLSMITGFALAAFYILPAWWEQRWVQISGAISTTYDPEHNFLFTRANDPDFTQFNWKISAVAIVLIALTIAAATFSRNLRHVHRKLWWSLFTLSIASILLMLPLSAFAWRHLPELRYLQFPWRWLLVLGFAFAFWAAAVTQRRTIVWLSIGLVLAATSVTIAGDSSWDSEDVPALIKDVRAGRGYEGIEGFQPRGANVDELDEDTPLVGEVDPESGDIDEPDNVKIYMKRWSAEDKNFETQSDESLKGALRLFAYPAWEAQIDGRTVRAETGRQTGQVLLPLDAGSHRVELHFRRTRDRTIGGVVSIVALICLLVPVTIRLSRRLRRT